MLMDEEKLDPLVRETIISRLEAWELVGFLQLPIEQIIDTFEDDIVDNLEDILDLIGFTEDDNEDDNGDG